MSWAEQEHCGGPSSGTLKTQLFVISLCTFYSYYLLIAIIYGYSLVKLPQVKYYKDYPLIFLQSCTHMNLKKKTSEAGTDNQLCGSCSGGTTITETQQGTISNASMIGSGVLVVPAEGVIPCPIESLVAAVAKVGPLVKLHAPEVVIDLLAWPPY